MDSSFLGPWVKLDEIFSSFVDDDDVVDDVFVSDLPSFV